MEYLKYLYNENYAELSNDFDDVFIIWLPSISTPLEAPEVDHRAEELVARDSALPQKVRRGGRFKIQPSKVHVPAPQGQLCWII